MSLCLCYICSLPRACQSQGAFTYACKDVMVQILRLPRSILLNNSTEREDLALFIAAFTTPLQLTYKMIRTRTGMDVCGLQPV